LVKIELYYAPLITGEQQAYPVWINKYDIQMYFKFIGYLLNLNEITMEAAYCDYFGPDNNNK
jgi:hypothetical protein